MLVRSGTALVLLAAFIAAVLLLDQLYFSILVGFVVALGAYEWSRLNQVSGVMSLVYAAACTYFWYGFIQYPAAVNGVLVLGAIFWILIAPSWLARGFLPAPYGLPALVGLLVLVPAGVAMLSLPRDLLLVLLGFVWLADTAAYLSGRAFGRRKLAPIISPQKTWEGVIGAAVSCLIYAMICAMLVPSLRAQIQGAIWVFYLLGAVLLCATSVLGDLFESAAKRRAGVKDSGTLLPGHGGVLDRIDSITAALPIGALLLRQLERA